MDEEGKEAEIFVSLDRISENASSNKVSFFEELSRVLVHGLLHMAGYDDSTKEENEEMRALENKHLARIVKL